MDVVDTILQKVPGLQPHYDEWLDYLKDDEGNLGDDFNLGSKLGNLSISLKCFAEDPQFDPTYFNIIMDELETFASNADADGRGAVEIMFLESMWWWAEDKEDEASQKYGDYFLSCLGPTCYQLYQKNKHFWKELNEKLNREREAKYAEMTRVYHEEKARKTSSSTHDEPDDD